MNGNQRMIRWDSRLVQVGLGMGLAAGLALSQPAAVDASVIFYTGDYTSGTSGYHQIGPDDTRATVRYASVEIPEGQTWEVDGLFALIGNPAGAPAADTAYWSFRTGMDASGGQVLAEGSLNVTFTDASDKAWLNGGTISPEYMHATLSETIVLEGGQTYWYTLVQNTPTYNRFIGTADASTGVNTSLTSDPWYRSRYLNPVTQVQVDEYATMTWSPSIGVTGVIPEPGSLALLGLSGMMLLRRGRERR